MERERGQVAQPPAKRMKLAPVVPTRGGGSGGGGQVASPRWRRLRQALLVVLFLVRARTTVTASISKLGRMLQRYVDCTFQKYHGMISRFISALLKKDNGTIGSKLESFQEQIQGLHHEVAKLSRLCSNRHADQQTRLEENVERIAANASNTNTRLRFLNILEPPVYTDENLTSQNHAAIKIAMFEGDNVVTSGALSKAKIEILVLRGDFSNKCRDNWTEDEFDKHIVQDRDGHDVVLGTVWLTNGIGELSQIRFREGSCRKKVIVAARVCKSKKTSGRVQEAIMQPVKVLDRRNKPNEKRHPPRLDDDLYRLEEIAKDGAYHKRLQEAQIHKVEGFLQALNEDPNKLHAMENQQNAWSKLTEHARLCVLEDRQELKRYHTKEGNVALFFNCVHELVGAAFPHEYVACQSFNATQKALVKKWRWHAYEKIKDISLDFVMKGNIPEPISLSSSTDVAAAPSILAVGASQQVSSANQLASYQGTGAAEYLTHNEHIIGQISPIANCGPTVPNNGPNAHCYQGTETAENLPHGKHGTPYQIADCGPIVANPDYLNTRYCQGQGIPLHAPHEVISPCPQNPQCMMDFSFPIELAGMDFDLYQDSGASTSAQAQLMFGPRNPTQPESTSPAAAPPWMPSMAEHDQGPSCSGCPGSGHE